LFEWVSRKNRVVVDYPEDNLILTGIRNTTKGVYLLYENMMELTEHWSIPIVKAVNGLAVQDINLFVKQVREWESDEGVVIRFNSGHMVKVKADDYVLRHKSKDSISQEKNVLQTILEDSVDDLVPLLTPEDAERIKNFEKAFWCSVENVAFEMANLFVSGNTAYPDKKDFATKFVQKKILPSYAPIMYNMKMGRSAKESLINLITKSISTQTKLEQNRWMFGNLVWNNMN
jgi:T4 RnlA family RNA ligase